MNDPKHKRCARLVLFICLHDRTNGGEGEVSRMFDARPFFSDISDLVRLLTRLGQVGWEGIGAWIHADYDERERTDGRRIYSSSMD